MLSLSFAVIVVDVATVDVKLYYIGRRAIAGLVSFSSPFLD